MAPLPAGGETQGETGGQMAGSVEGRAVAKVPIAALTYDSAPTGVDPTPATRLRRLSII